jgi:hypothetical protein
VLLPPFSHQFHGSRNRHQGDKDKEDGVQYAP